MSLFHKPMSNQSKVCDNFLKKDLQPEDAVESFYTKLMDLLMDDVEMSLE